MSNATVTAPAAIRTQFVDLNAYARQIRVGDYLINGAQERIVLITKVEHLHSANRRVRLSGVKLEKGGKIRRAWVRTVRPQDVAAIARPFSV